MFNEFRVLNYESFEKIVCVHCKDLVYQEKTRINELTGKPERIEELTPVSAYYLDLEVLLPSGLTPEEIDALIYRVDSNKKKPLSETFLSKCRNSKKDIPYPIRLAYLKDKTEEEAVNLVKSSFDDDLLPLIHGDDRIMVIHELTRVIDRDDTIPRVYRSKFKSCDEKESLSLFLAEIFVFIMTKDISTKIIELEERERMHPRINPLVRRVIDDVAKFGRSDSYIPVFELLCSYVQDCRNGIENTNFTNEDIIEFIEGTEGLNKELTHEQNIRFDFDLVVTVLTELSERYVTEYDKAEAELKDRLLRKHHLYKAYKVDTDK